MSRHEFVLPDLGEGIGEAEVVGWLAQVGDLVNEHEALVEVQTDKALVQLPAPVTGLLLAQGAAVGDTIKLGGLVAAFEIRIAPATARRQRALAAPTVRQLARDLGVDLQGVMGSGPGGRVLAEDVEQAARVVQERDRPSAAAPTLSAPAAVAVKDGSDRIPLRGLRRAIARKMTETLRTVPQVTGLLEIDVTEVERLLERLKPAASARGVRLTWTAFFALATIESLHQFPQLNASLDPECEEIIVHRNIHLGIATATDQGLLVPVVRHADGRSLLDLAAEITRVTEAARNRKATAAELTGSTFTLTNYGAVGGWFGTPMVNTPETGIAGFGRVERRPAVVDGAVLPRTMVALSTTVDHRLIDGIVNAMFGTAIRACLEEPHLLLLGARRGHG